MTKAQTAQFQQRVYVVLCAYEARHGDSDTRARDAVVMQAQLMARTLRPGETTGSMLRRAISSAEWHAAKYPGLLADNFVQEAWADFHDYQMKCEE